MTQARPARPETGLKNETSNKMIPNIRFCEKNRTEYELITDLINTEICCFTYYILNVPVYFPVLQYTEAFH